MATINYDYGSRPIYTLSQAMGEFLFATLDEDTNQIVKHGRDLGDKYTAVELFKAYIVLEAVKYNMPLGPLKDLLDNCIEIKDIFTFLNATQSIDPGSDSFLLEGWGYSGFTVEDALSVLEPASGPEPLESIDIRMWTSGQESPYWTTDSASAGEIYNALSDCSFEPTSDNFFLYNDDILINFNGIGAIEANEDGEGKYISIGFTVIGGASIVYKLRFNDPSRSNGGLEIVEIPPLG